MVEETLYERLTPAGFESRIKAAPIAYLSLGTLEWHGPHLPLGSDFLQSQGLFKKLAERVGGIVLPPLFLGPDSMREVDGVEYYGMDLSKTAPDSPRQLKGSAYWVPDWLFSETVEAVLKQLRRAGFRIVVAHGHGPSTNHFVRNGESLGEKLDLIIMTVWRGEEERQPSTEFQYDHAAANETSIMMALHPDLVHMGQLPTDSDEWLLGIIGEDPREHASATHGQEIIDIHLERMESMLKKRLLELRREKDA
ncbi:MAG: creatininase family protein [Candidatus Bathyarchaeota archaeon]|nr:MAG: creatininase family protein [Candidatus Bathyarchaeota archaeon]